jgi:integrase
MGLIGKPVVYGPGFKVPDLRSFRIEKAKKGEKLFTPDEIKALLAVATPSMNAMVMLGINCGFGNADCAQLPLRAIDLDRGWLSFPRPKTGFGRRCPLWPETVAAIRAWLVHRPNPADLADAELVFLTAKGNTWHKDSSDNPVSKEMAKLIKLAKLPIGRSFYALRHTHRTIGDEVCDQRASNYIMGHVDPTMSAHYVERIGDERLRRVADHVRAWLYPPKKKQEPTKRGKKERPTLQVVTEDGDVRAAASA